jgi:hypothetical protein
MVSVTAKLYHAGAEILRVPLKRSIAVLKRDTGAGAGLLEYQPSVLCSIRGEVIPGPNAVFEFSVKGQ